MEINFRHYTNEYGFNDDFFEIFEFFKKHGRKGINENWHWGRWEWLIGHPNLKKEMLSIIGIWELNDVIVAVATHDMRIGKAYIICNSLYRHLEPEILKYAENNLSFNSVLKIAANNEDYELLKLLEKNNYCKKDDTEVILSLNCENRVLEYCLPDGFTISSFALDGDINKHNGVIYKGFNHEGEPPLIDETDYKTRPHFNPLLTIFVLAPDGEYAAHCGMWYDPDIDQSYIEPVVTIPKYRKLGLGKAAIYECINRCSAMGAKSAQVISNQQFYYRIGFEKSSVYSFWSKKII